MAALLLVRCGGEEEEATPLTGPFLGAWTCVTTDNDPFCGGQVTDTQELELRADGTYSYAQRRESQICNSESSKRGTFGAATPTEAEMGEWNGAFDGVEVAHKLTPSDFEGASPWYVQVTGDEMWLLYPDSEGAKQQELWNRR